MRSDKLGIFRGGAIVGARLLPRLSNRTLSLIFIPIMAAIAIEMVLRGLGLGAF